LLGFFGTHGLAHGLDFILDCAPALAAENIHLLLAGDGERRAKLIERARSENLRNVHFVDPVQRKDVPALVAQCDGALVNLIASPTFLDVIPSKIFEAAALQCPILLGVDGITREIVERFGAGIFYQPEDKNSFVTAARRLKTDTQLYLTLKEGCRALAKAYNRDQLADRALEVIRSCAASTNSRTA
jgi:glycosyltransferase involved in cell wall biosynthesis